MSKVNWHVRLDTWLSYMFNMITGGKLSDFIKMWYDHKYPTFDLFTLKKELPTMLPGFLWVEKWVKLDGIDLPIAVVDSYTPTAMVMMNATIVDDNDEYSQFEYLIITTALLDILNDDEVMAVLHHEMRHTKRHWLVMVGRTRFVNNLLSKVDDPRWILRLDKVLYAPISWVMEFDADRVPKQYRNSMASALMSIAKESVEVVGKLTGICATHPPMTLRAFFLRK